MFHLTNFLEDTKTDYQPQNKSGWTHIQCPFCDDNSYHLGIKQKAVHCWKCGTHTFIDMIQELVPKENPYFLIRKYSSGNGETNDKRGNDRKLKAGKTQVNLPLGCSALNNGQKNYLVNRGFSPTHIQDDWEVRGVGSVGNYRFRIIIPIYHKGELVSYQGRDYTGKQKEKYKSCAGVSLKDYLYGLDYTKQGDKIIVVEGVPGVWRLGKGKAIATFGINYTQQQVRLIALQKFRKVGVLFDIEPQARLQAELLTGSLCMIGVDAVKLKLPKGRKDPDELSKEEIIKILNF